MAEPVDELAMPELVRLLQELLAQYQDPLFQLQLQQLQLRASVWCASDVRAAKKALAAKVQEPILQRYRFPPGEAGLLELRHLVRRRVAEGCQRVESLANLTRQSLGLPKLEVCRSVEEVLEEQRKQTQEALRCDVLGRVPVHVRASCVERVAREVAQQCISRCHGELLTELLRSGEVPVSAVLSMLTMARKGLPLLRLRRLRLAIVIKPAMSKQQLWQHVLASQPVLLREQFQCPEFLRLGEEAFLQSLGEGTVHVKAKSFMSRKGCPVFMCEPSLKMPFSEFLESLKKRHCPFYLGKAPIATELPSLQKHLDRHTAETDAAGAAITPLELFGGCFGALVPAGVYTYMGAGRNTTSIHFDGYENLMMCMRGKKHICLWPPWAAAQLYPVGESFSCPDGFTRSAVSPGGLRFEELEAEEQARLACYRHAEPLRLTLEPGQLLYLPAGWWHCVEGSMEPNMILTPRWTKPDPACQACEGEGGGGYFETSGSERWLANVGSMARAIGAGRSTGSMLCQERIN
ncbi:unnamed protein product [Durusdinium trenchii]|uniref:JmjC domain-containing protein n=1 Tax=Durusdinium trenchii TaxID=1381693 RepID=A0ABP0I479_9DINO